MKDLLKKLNDLPVFDPSLWPRRELLSRTAGIAACSAFVIHRVLRFSRYTGDMPPFLADPTGAFPGSLSWRGIPLTAADWHWIMWFFVWIIETGIFVVYILAFLTRREAKGIARGFMEVVFPLIIAGASVVITLTPMNFRDVWPPLLAQAGSTFVSSGSTGSTWAAIVFLNWEPAFFLFLFLVISGGIINLSGLLTLRRAFTIMSEARMLIRNGIFSRVRHPLYTGHFVMFFGYLMFHLYWYTCVLYALFIVGQYVRARIEEEKLETSFPEYADYRKSAGMFFPRLLQ